MDPNQPGPSQLDRNDPGWLDPSIQVEMDCICASTLTKEEKSKVYNKILPSILKCYRSGQVPDDNEAIKIAGAICADAKARRMSIRELRPNVVAGAVIKFMIYIVSKDLGMSSKKVDTVAGIAHKVIYTAVSNHFIVWEHELSTGDEVQVRMGFWDPVVLNDTIMEICQDGDLNPLRVLNESGEPLKANVKSYRNFHEVLLKLDGDEMLTKYTKATVGYLALKLYFDNIEKAEKQNDILWTASQWMIHAADDIFRWRRDEAIGNWSKWRDQLGQREIKLRTARGNQGNASELEKILIKAREEMRAAPGRIVEERQRVASYQAGKSTS